MERQVQDSLEPQEVFSKIYQFLSILSIAIELQKEVYPHLIQVKTLETYQKYKQLSATPNIKISRKQLPKMWEKEVQSFGQIHERLEKAVKFFLKTHQVPKENEKQLVGMIESIKSHINTLKFNLNEPTPPDSTTVDLKNIT